MCSREKMIDLRGAWIKMGHSREGPHILLLLYAGEEAES
jgi:hypothetical protein